MNEAENKIKEILENVKSKLNPNGRTRVFEDKKEISSEFMVESSEPEAFTKEFIIEKVFNFLELEKLPEKQFETPTGKDRSVDYRIKNQKGDIFLVETKPINAELFDKSKDGAVNQIKSLFKLVEVRDKYKFGIATDGLKWVFVNKEGKVIDKEGNALKERKEKKGVLHLITLERLYQESDYEEIRARLTGEESEVLKLIKKIKKTGEPLSKLEEKLDIKIHNGITAESTKIETLNKIFIIDQHILSASMGIFSADIIKPILRKEDINRWGYTFRKFYLIYSYFSEEEEIKKHKTVYEYLEQHKNELEHSHQWHKLEPHQPWYMLRECEYYQEQLEKEKIVVVLNETKDIYFPIIPKGFFVEKCMFFITGKEKDLKIVSLILQSRLCQFMCCAVERRIKEVPIKIPFDKTPFVLLCDHMLFLNETEEHRNSEKEMIEFFDRQIINSLVYELYFADELKTNLINLVSPYLADISNLDSDSEKLNTIKKTHQYLKSNKEILDTITTIKNHERVKIIEQENKN